MTTSKKRGPIRQYSLQCDSPKITERRRSLKKQFSEDLIEISSAHDVQAPNGIRVSMSAKGTKRTEHPPTLKLAWSETGDSVKKGNEALQKYSSENKQNVNKIVKQHSLDKNIIFNSRQLVEKRSNTEAKVEEKQNLNIFLGSNIKDARDDELSDSSYSSVDNRCKLPNCTNPKVPKFILPLSPNVSNNDNMKSVFQKHIRKITKQKSLFLDSCYSPTRSESCSTIVVPIVSNKPSQKELKLHRQASLDIDISKRKVQSESTETKSDLGRPSMASSRREAFQKRSTSATSTSFITKEKKESNFRPPLVRTSSVPVKQEAPKPKFLATKRRVKTAKAKVRISGSNGGTTDDDEFSVNKKGWLKRCVSVNGCEVETMVSLVSPSGSENEDEARDEKEKQLGEEPTKASSLKQETQEVSKHRSFSLRKTVKTVSFQQSTIHAIRSFSASFPERRGSMATPLFLNHSGVAQMIQTQKIQEKRAPVNAIEDEERVPKRRLIRTKSAPLQRSTDDETPDRSTTSDNTSSNRSPADSENHKITPSSPNKTGDTQHSQNSNVKQRDPSNPATSSYENSKERQCWDMYCKMSEKGVTISFDTILRGMLTPTEYRLRSKAPSEVPEDNCEIAEN